jgi:hypothetical protein
MSKLPTRNAEQNEILGAFINLLEGPTGDGGAKRAAGVKANWKVDDSHEAAAFRHLGYWMDGERFDGDSGCHALAHAAWRLLAIAYRESEALREGEPDDAVRVDEYGYATPEEIQADIDKVSGVSDLQRGQVGDGTEEFMQGAMPELFGEKPLPEQADEDGCEDIDCDDCYGPSTFVPIPAGEDTPSVTFDAPYEPFTVPGWTHQPTVNEDDLITLDTHPVLQQEAPTDEEWGEPFLPVSIHELTGSPTTKRVVLEAAGYRPFLEFDTLEWVTGQVKFGDFYDRAVQATLDHYLASGATIPATMKLYR